ncbi:hypothetical protein C8R43DRAFT_1125673 [Mycena crocata]|nr:hypothetical protein C8R43DRAFT_1125673 [Mycena crocata]
MYALQLEYMQEARDETSIFNRVTMISSKNSLLPADLIDQGINSEDLSLPRLSLEAGLSYRVMRTIAEAQEVVSRASDLVPGRESGFIIDPHGALKSILTGATSLDEITIAWKSLSRRMELAQQYLEKYESQYQMVNTELMPTSPASTAPELYENSPTTKSAMTQLTYLYDHVPHHHSQLPKGYDPDTGKLPRYLPASNGLQRVFPSRWPEINPPIVTYTPNGERVERSYSSRAWEKAPDVPERIPIHAPSSRQPQVPTPMPFIAEEDPNSSVSRSKKDTEGETVSTQYWSGTQLLSHNARNNNVPMKPAAEMLVGRSPHRKDFVNAGAPWIPNTVEGMVSTRYSTAESVSQGMNAWRRQETERYPRLMPRTDAGKNRGSISQGPVFPGSNREGDYPREVPPHLTSRIITPPIMTKGFGHPSSQEGRSPTRPNSRPASRNEEANQQRRQTAAGGRNPEEVTTTTTVTDPVHGNLRVIELQVTLETDSRMARPIRVKEGDRHHDHQVLTEAVTVATRMEEVEETLGCGSLMSRQEPPMARCGANGSFEGMDARSFGLLVGLLSEAALLSTDVVLYVVVSPPGGDVLTLHSLPGCIRFTRMLASVGIFEHLPRSWISDILLIISNVPEPCPKAYRVPSSASEPRTLDDAPQTCFNLLSLFPSTASVDNGGRLEVFTVMRRAPIVWSTILVIENIQNSEELYDKVYDHDEELIVAAQKNSGDTLTVHNLASTLRRMGFSQTQGAPRASRQANVVSTSEGAEALSSLEEIFTEGVVSSWDPLEGSETVKQAYNTIKRRQRPPPKDGYPFEKNDHVTTKIGKAPPSPCKVSGSANHWDRECPDWHVYIKKQKHGVLITTTWDRLYKSGGSGSGGPESSERKPKADLNTENGSFVPDIIKGKAEVETHVEMPRVRRSAHNVQIEEIEDEYWVNDVRMPKAKKGIMERVSEAEKEEALAEAAIVNEVEEIPPPPAAGNDCHNHPTPQNTQIG